jgi:hypothetical protein
VKLDDFFGTMAPLLTGQHSPTEVARSLYGDAGGGKGQEPWRLAVYGSACRDRRAEVIDNLYAHCKRVVLERQGPRTWGRLVEDYFLAHPMKLFELNANGARLSEFLAHYAPERGLPGWLPELADLEWWEWEVLVAADTEPADTRPCLAPTVELRPYTHDLVGWMDTAASERSEAPEPREGLVIFWRQEGTFRRENVSPLELLVIKAVHEGLGLEAVAEEAGGVPVEALEEIQANLVEAGILLAEDSAS